jgi:ATP synthase protein I
MANGMTLPRKARTATHPDRGRWDDEEDEAAGSAIKRLTPEEAAALRAKEPPVSPWWVLGVQLVVGVAVALLAVLLSGRQEVAWSALYGAATVVVPGAVMARGATRRVPGMSALAGAVSLVSWSVVKIGFSVAMLVLAPRIVQPLVWPALLAALVLCIQVYWLALLWRRRG